MGVIVSTAAIAWIGKALRDWDWPVVVLVLLSELLVWIVFAEHVGSRIPPVIATSAFQILTKWRKLVFAALGALIIGTASKLAEDFLSKAAENRLSPMVVQPQPTAKPMNHSQTKR